MSKRPMDWDDQTARGRGPPVVAPFVSELCKALSRDGGRGIQPRRCIKPMNKARGVRRRRAVMLGGVPLPARARPYTGVVESASPV